MNLPPIRWLAPVSGLTLSVCLGGCGSHDGWFPMKVGRHWTYQVRAGFDRKVESLQVIRPLTVASADGFELSGPLGVSRLAWKHGTLYADSAANAGFNPPLPMLVPGVDLAKEIPRQVAVWHGRVIVMGKEQPGSAVLTERTESLDLGARKVPTILATLQMQVPGGKIELRSWYQEGIGLVQQEQRTNGARIVQLQQLDRGGE